MRNSVLKHTLLMIEGFKSSERIFDVLKLGVPALMGIFIFLNPFPHTTAIKESCFYLSFFIVLLLIYFKQIDFSFKSPITLPFVLFTTWAFISLFFAIDKENSLHDFYAHLLKYLVFYYILINIFNSKKLFEALTWIIIVSATIFAIGGTIYFYKFLSHPVYERLGFPGIAAINNIGFITVPAMLLSLNLFNQAKKIPHKMVLLICLSGTLTASLLTQTIGTLLGIIVSLSVLLLTRNKKPLVALFVVLFILLGLFPIKDRITFNTVLDKFNPQNAERVKIWYTHFQIIKEHPIQGVGVGMRSYTSKVFLDRFEHYRATAPARYKPNCFHTPHNMFIELTVRLGFIGLAFFLYIISMFAYMGYKMIKYGHDDSMGKWTLCLVAVMIAFLIQGFFADIIFHVYLISLYTILAMMTIVWRINAESDPSKLQKK